ncbi:hypothetical protein NKH19_23310 [Mesorhizobium sp. M1338]|uniref:hypothetical protein n=1 Tax=unclassified Mesorhizobium TaxID=325217 RepID=UPI003334B291
MILIESTGNRDPLLGVSGSGMGFAKQEAERQVDDNLNREREPRPLTRSENFAGEFQDNE